MGKRETYFSKNPSGNKSRLGMQGTPNSIQNKNKEFKEFLLLLQSTNQIPQMLKFRPGDTSANVSYIAEMALPAAVAKAPNSGCPAALAAADSDGASAGKILFAAPKAPLKKFAMELK